MAWTSNGEGISMKATIFKVKDTRRAIKALLKVSDL